MKNLDWMKKKRSILSVCPVEASSIHVTLCKLHTLGFPIPPSADDCKKKNFWCQSLHIHLYGEAQTSRNNFQNTIFELRENLRKQMTKYLKQKHVVVNFFAPFQYFCFVDQCAKSSKAQMLLFKVWIKSLCLIKPDDQSTLSENKLNYLQCKWLSIWLYQTGVR